MIVCRTRVANAPAARYLDGNLLSYIAPASFDQMTSLTTLYICVPAFAECAVLTRISLVRDLGSNSLVGFPSGLLDPLTSLGTLYVPACPWQYAASEL